MPTREEITYILLHDKMPEHPKIEGLSDPAFRLLITMWCWCARNTTDGHVPAAVWRKRGTPASRKALTDAGLVDKLATDDVEMHDYLDIQRSAAEVEAARSAKSDAGLLGNHRRWHVARRISDPDCSLCLKGVVA